jgi:AmmeMemoRadiSam system protein B
MITLYSHAGYDYCADNAAYAYKCLDLANAKRIFLLGPSHTMYLSGCAVTSHATYATPLGDLAIDQGTIDELKVTGKFESIPHDVDDAEHSLEMHCPYIYTMCARFFSKAEDYPTLVPVMVGNTAPAVEKAYGILFSSYLADPTSIFVVSSDFCHWGGRFRYTYYIPNRPAPGVFKQGGGYQLQKSGHAPAPTDPPIHESIDKLDQMSMDAIEAGTHERFLDNMSTTENTVCGRHPIGIVLAAIDTLRESGKIASDHGRFKFIHYSRSSDPLDISDSSVSYASAYATV